MLLALCGFGPGPARAQVPSSTDSRCGNADVRVRAADTGDLAAACDGARRALAFLARSGLDAGATIEIELQPLLPPGLRSSAAGCYDRRTRRVTVLTYAEFLQRGTWFEVPVDRELHRSAVAHEVAHAVVGCQPTALQLSLPAHEYMAYATMFATMEPALRERLLGHYPGSGFDHEAQINALMYALDPMRFGVNAWKHFSQLSDGGAFFRRILAGEALRDELVFAD